MQRTYWGKLYLLVILLSLSLACSPTPSEEEGAAQLVTTLSQAISASDVTDVRVTVSVGGTSTRTVSLVRTGNQWGGVLGNLPAGAGRTFRGEAFNFSGTLLYAGEATGVEIVAGQTTLVSLTLQEVSPTPPFENAAPVITSLVANPRAVSPGGTVTLQATATDANAGDALSYAWIAGGGTFSAPLNLSTAWTAPNAPGLVNITFTVTDSKGAQAVVNFVLAVQSTYGSAAVNVVLNSWPQVTRVLASPTAVEVGKPTAATATVTDNDGDSLSYSWAASCQGAWSNASSATATFIPSSHPAGNTCPNCALTVTVTDGKGGQTTGTLSICVGAKPTASFPPEIMEAFQSVASTTANSTVVFRVRAVDPQGGPLTFSWHANVGTLSAPTSLVSSSEVSWTAPSCLPPNTAATLTATITNALSISTSHSFQVTGLPVCSAIARLQFAAGESHTMTLNVDGSVWAWGFNGTGLLGDGTNIAIRTTPVRVQGLSGVISISVGKAHTVALKSDGTVWTWGLNHRGQLGNGTTLDVATPLQVQSLSGITSIAAGYSHTLALRSDGTVWAWGHNMVGELGDGTTTIRFTPVRVQSLSGVISIAAGRSHSLALKSDGTVWAWGSNWDSQLGVEMGSSPTSSIPVQIPGFSGVTSLGAGGSHSLALKSDGTVWAWGSNTKGQLGDATIISRSATPIQVPGLTGVTSIVAADFHTLASKSDGTVWAWGNNEGGELGDGTTTSRFTPVQVQGLSGVVSIGAGYTHTLASKSDGTVWAWGDNNSGKLGNGTTIDSTTPVQVQNFSL